MGAPIGKFACSAALTAFLALPASSSYSFSEFSALIVCSAFAAQFLLWVLYRVFMYPFYVSPFRNLPQPPGHVFWKGQLKNPLADPVKWSQTIPNDGLIRYFDEYCTERVLVTSAKGLADMLVNKSYDFVKPASTREQMARFLRLGLLITEGDVHQRQRKLLLRAFSFRHLKELHPIMWSKAAEAVESIQRNLPESGSVGIGDWVSRTIIDTIGATTMDNDFNTIREPNNEVINAYEEVFKQNPAAQFRGKLALLVPTWILAKLPSDRSRKIEINSELVRKYCRKAVRESVSKADREEYNNSIISILTKNGGFGAEELADQLMTFLAAGHETTTLAVMWAILLLARHQNIQARLRSEIRAQLPSPSDKESYDEAATNLDAVPYLHAIANETFRLYPAIPFNVREASRDTSILEYHIPKGIRVTFSAWGMNTSKDQWGEDAEEFNPDRWMGSGRANTGGAKSNFAFETFVQGPRSCLGMGFAKAEVACLIGALVGRFEISLLPAAEEILKIWPGVSLKRYYKSECVKLKVMDGW